MATSTFAPVKQSLNRWKELLKRLDSIKNVILECEDGSDFAQSMQFIGATLARENGQLATDGDFEDAMDSFNHKLFIAGVIEVNTVLRDAMKACSAERSCRDLLIVFAIAHEGMELFNSFMFLEYPKYYSPRAITSARACFRQIRPKFIEALSAIRADVMLSSLLNDD